MRASWPTLLFLGAALVQALSPAGLGNSTIPTAVNRPNNPAADGAAPADPQLASPTQIEEKTADNSSVPTAPNTDNGPNPTPESPAQPPGPPAEKNIPQPPSPNPAPPPVPAPAPAPPALAPAAPALPSPPSPPAPAAPPASLQEAQKNTPGPAPPNAAPEPLKPSPPRAPKENTPSIPKETAPAFPQQRQVQGSSQLIAAPNSGPQPSVMPGLYFFPNPNPMTNSISGNPSNSDALVSLLMSQSENKESSSSQTSAPMPSSLLTDASSMSGSQRSSVTLMNDFVPASFSIPFHNPPSILNWVTMIFSILFSLI